MADAGGIIIQKTHYEPFGKAFEEEDDEVKEEEGQPYLYNGKELYGKHGLNLYDYHARLYNYEKKSFDTMDPLAEKYPSISPYVYVGNNPINAVDLRGDSITTLIDGNSYSWGQVGDKHGFVGSDGNLYSGKDKYVNSLTNAINQLRSKDAGRTLVDYLAGDAGSVEIRDGASNNVNVVRGRTIDWNDSNRNPNAPRDGFIGLAHEMGHIEDKWKNGKVNWDEWAKVTKADGTPYIVREAEKHALHRENQVRSEHGKNLRTHYAYDINGNGTSSTQFIQNGASMFHFRGTQHTTTIVHGVPIITITKISFKY